MEDVYNFFLMLLFVQDIEKTVTGSQQQSFTFIEGNCLSFGTESNPKYKSLSLMVR